MDPIIIHLTLFESHYFLSDLIFVNRICYRNSTLQRIILQKSAEWTPKKSKKKIRDEGDWNGEEAPPSSVKVKRSSAKKKKGKKMTDEEEDIDEHSDANILLLLSASKPVKSIPKVLKYKSPSKKALKLLIKEAEADQDGDEISTSPGLLTLQKQKFKRIMKQFVSSKSNGGATAGNCLMDQGDCEGEGDGDRIMNPRSPVRSPVRTPRVKAIITHGLSMEEGSYLSPRGQSKSITFIP